jgi:hypothetical protein
MSRHAVLLLLGVALLAAGCGPARSDWAEPAVAEAAATPEPSDAPAAPTETARAPFLPGHEPVPGDPGPEEADPEQEDPTPEPSAPAPEALPAEGRPEWLGTRPLPLGADGYGLVQDTPQELEDRRFPPAAALPPPPGGRWEATIEPAPPAVLRRSTWSAACPVAADELAWARFPYWGFDDQPHGGELLLHVDVAEDVVAAFQVLYAARYPIEEMRIVGRPELGAPATGDANTTSAFVCRAATGGGRWSEHAYGMAVDINPFHNPYIKGDLVIPELASAYLDRDRDLPGMILPGSVVTEAFETIGWGWGGEWNSSRDYMHFSATGH